MTEIGNVVFSVEKIDQLKAVGCARIIETPG
jgi:hypothetical protein